MNSNPVQKAITTEENYPKNISLKWGRVKESNVRDCRTLSKKNVKQLLTVITIIQQIHQDVNKYLIMTQYSHMDLIKKHISLKEVKYSFMMIKE